MRRVVILKTSAFLAIAILLLHGLARLAEQWAPDGTLFFLQVDDSNVKTLLRHAHEAEAIALGSSHGDDVDFSEMDYRGYQLSRAWGDIFETQYYLDYFVPRLPNLKVVLIAMSYFSFDWDNAASQRLNVRREQLYRAVGAWSPIPGDTALFVRAKATELVPVKSILREDNWQQIVYALLSGERPESALETLTDDCSPLTVEDLTRHAEIRAGEQIQMASDIAQTHQHVRMDTFKTLAETVRELQEKEIRVVLFTPPYYEAYTRVYQEEDPETIAFMKDRLAFLQRTYDVEYYDFSQDARFVGDHTLFKDSDHLNSCGRELFSRMLNDQLLTETLER